MLNALRMLEPDASHTVLISFSPNRGAKFQETLEIQTPTSTLHVLVKGNGISPLINLSVEGGCYEFGAVIAGEYREESFKARTERTAVISCCFACVYLYFSRRSPTRRSCRSSTISRWTASRYCGTRKRKKLPSSSNESLPST